MVEDKDDKLILPKIIENKTNKELKQLAYDMINGEVFTDRHIPADQPEMISAVFPVLRLLDGKQLTELKDSNIGMIYEYVDKAGPAAVNDLPMFMSCEFLNEDDATKVIQFYHVIKEQVDKMLDEEDNKEVSTTERKE